MMLKFVSKWIAEKNSESSKSSDEIIFDNGWIDPQNGLPDTDRRVMIITVKERQYYAPPYNILSTARFTPFSGWSDSCKVLAWKELDSTLKQFLDFKY